MNELYLKIDMLLVLKQVYLGLDKFVQHTNQFF